MRSQLLPKTKLTRMPDPTLHLFIMKELVRLMQLPKADTTGDSLVIHPINKEDGYDLISVPSIQHFSTSLSS